jgi:hypothetical protein
MQDGIMGGPCSCKHLLHDCPPQSSIKRRQKRRQASRQTSPAKMPHWQNAALAKCRPAKNAALAKCPETPKAKKRPATEAAGRV